MRHHKLDLCKTAIFLAALITISSCAIARNKSKVPAKTNTLTKKQISNGWKLLFDGKTLNGFKGATNDKVLNTCWKVENGQIICTDRDQRPAKLGGSIVTKDKYSSFDFRLDYRLDPKFKGGHVNSGVKYFAYPKTELGLEYQIYDADAEVRSTGALADLYDILPAKARPAKPRGQWNSVRIVVRGNHVEHWINGKKVLEFERGSEQFRAAVAKSKFKNRDKFGEAKEGYILLQDHGGGIAFRNIRIKVLED
ncbi:MAG: DUF1080 domain-containing protein [Planctomycetota bacterium]|nr:DUF1080 domain-containing protein [Planctomycetota bacterium]